MKMKDIVKETRIWKSDYLDLDVKVAEKRKEYCLEQHRLGRTDGYAIYQESRRKYK